MTDDHCFIGIVCVESEYPERLAYKMINEVVSTIIGVYGEDAYHETAPSQIRSAISMDFAKLIKKYDNPAGFDKLASAQAKVDLAVYSKTIVCFVSHIPGIVSLCPHILRGRSSSGANP